MVKNFNITTKIDFDTFRIYINNCLYVLIIKDKFIGLQSWKSGEGKWCIEFYTSQNKILTEFDSAEKWKAVLDTIDKELNI